MSVHEVAAHRLGFPRKLAKWVTVTGAMMAYQWSAEVLQAQEPEQVVDDYQPGGYL